MTPDHIEQVRTAVKLISDREHQIIVQLDDNAQLLDRVVELLDAVTDPPSGLRLIPRDVS